MGLQCARYRRLAVQQRPTTMPRLRFPFHRGERRSQRRCRLGPCQALAMLALVTITPIQKQHIQPGHSQPHLPHVVNFGSDTRRRNHSIPRQVPSFRLFGHLPNACQIVLRVLVKSDQPGHRQKRRCGRIEDRPKSASVSAIPWTTPVRGLSFRWVATSTRFPSFQYLHRSYVVHPLVGGLLWVRVVRGTVTGRPRTSRCGLESRFASDPVVAAVEVLVRADGTGVGQQQSADTSLLTPVHLTVGNYC